MKFINVFLLFIVSLMVNSECLAVTTEEAVKQGFIDVGLFLFIGGLCIILIPRFTKLAIIFMLLGDFLVLARIFAGYEIIKYINNSEYTEYINNLSYSDFRIILFCSLFVLMVVLGFLGYLKNLIWRSFWGIFGFYKKTPVNVKTTKSKSTKKDISEIKKQKSDN